MVKGFDVVVAGAGPAGTAAAAVLAAGGLSVALLDCLAHPRPKLCGGLLTAKSMEALSRVFGLAEADLLAHGGMFHKTPDYVFLHQGRELMRGAAAVDFRFVDRPDFDALLLGTAIRRGAVFFPGARVLGCEVRGGLVRTSLGEFQGRFVIGADGANSVLRRCAFAASGQTNQPNQSRQGRELWRQGLAAAIEVELPPEAFPRAVRVPELHVGQPEAGYGWVFPGPRGPKVGICGLRRAGARQRDFGAIFRDFLRLLGVAGVEGIPLHGHPLPYGNALARPCAGRLLLAGDAGGFVEPLFGEGIFYAMATGAHAASAVLTALDSPGGAGTDIADTGNAATDTAAREYGRLLDATVRPEFLWSDRLRWLLFGAMKHFGARPIGLFVRSAPAALAEMVHGGRSFRLLAKKRWEWGRGVAE